MNSVSKNDVLYIARIMPTIPLFEILEVKVRTITDTYFVGCEKVNKQAYLFPLDSLGKKVFKDRKECLLVVQNAENKYKEREEKCIT